MGSGLQIPDFPNLLVFFVCFVFFVFFCFSGFLCISAIKFIKKTAQNEQPQKTKKTLFLEVWIPVLVWGMGHPDCPFSCVEHQREKTKKTKKQKNQRNQRFTNYGLRTPDPRFPKSFGFFGFFVFFGFFCFSGFLCISAIKFIKKTAQNEQPQKTKKTLFLEVWIPVSVWGMGHPDCPFSCVEH